jgi:hypothetical protein
VEKADAAVSERGDLHRRFLVLGRAVRRWALANPAEYALIFGSPVPGYAAPADTVVAAQRTPDVLLGIFVDGLAAGTLGATATAGAELPPALRVDMTAARDAVAPSLPPDVFALGTIAWIHIFGAVSFELFGQLNNVIEARDDYFDYQLRQIADLVGLG